MKPQGSATSSTGDEPESVRLSWLVAQSGLGLGAVHLPDTDRAVEWAHAIELDDPRPWLSGQGLVLTTGLRLPRAVAGQSAYVDRLVEGGVTALGFGTGLRFATVPTGVVAACREHDLPLLEVPLPTPFLAVTQAVSDRLGELRRLRLQESLTAQRRLTRAALRGGGAEVVRTLARVLGAGVLVLDEDLERRLRAGSPRVVARTVAGLVADRAGAAGMVAPESVLEVQPLGGRPAERHGWLAVQRGTPLTATDRLVLSHAVAVLTLELARPGVEAPVDTVGPALVDALVAGAPVAPAALTALGLDPARPVRLVAVRAEDPSARSAVVHSLRGQGPVLAGHSPGSGTDLLLLVPDSTEPVALREAAIALGTAVGWEAVATSSAAVLSVLEVTHPGSVARVDDLPAERLLADPAVERALSATAGGWLDVLEEYDAAQGTDLVVTLAAFLRHHGAWDPAARELEVHRHTVRHRIGRVGTLTGCDLDDPTDRALLVLALTRRPYDPGLSQAVQRSIAW